MEILKKIKNILPPRPTKIPTTKRWLYFPNILNQKEKRLITSLVTLMVISGGALLANVYIKSTTPAPAIGGTYREGILKEPHTINPIFISNNDTDRDLVQLVYSSLITYDGRGRVVPDLAESYGISEDKKTYRVRLRNNVLWHDGEKFSADDVLFTIQTIQNPLYKSPLRPNWQGVKVERLDDYSMRFVLKQPYSPFLENLTVGILPKHLWGSVDPQSAPLHELNLHPVGSGPYRFGSIKQKSNGDIVQYVMYRNKNYYRGGPNIKEIIFNFYKTEEEMIAAQKAEKIDGLSFVSATNTHLLKNEKLKIYTLRMPRIFAIFLNRRAPLLDNKNIRSALSLAVDKKKISEDVLSGGAVAIDSPLPPGTIGYTKDVATYDFSPEKARTILAQEGWRDENHNSVLEKKERKKGKLETTELKIKLTTSDWPALIKTAEAIKEMWSKIGVATELETLPIAQLEGSVIKPRNYDALLFGEVYGHVPDPFAFWHSSQIKDPGLNISFYSNKRVDTLLEEARRLSDERAIEKRYVEFQKILSEDGPAIFLNSQLYFYALPSYIKGVDMRDISLPSDRFNGVNAWFINTKRVFR